jgi:hypothetical protein
MGGVYLLNLLIERDYLAGRLHPFTHCGGLDSPFTFPNWMKRYFSIPFLEHLL